MDQHSQENMHADRALPPNQPQLQANNPANDLPDPLEYITYVARVSLQKTKELGAYTYGKVSDPEFRAQLTEKAKYALGKSKEVISLVRCFGV